MKRLSKLLAAATAIASLAACGHEAGISTASAGKSFTEALSENSPNTLEIRLNVEYPVPGPGMSGETAEKITVGIVSYMLGSDSAAPEAAMDGYIAKAVAEYREYAAEMMDGMDIPEDEKVGALCWENYMDIYLYGRHGNTVTFCSSNYTYGGGAHGGTVEKCLSFNLKDGTPVTEEDLFREDYKDRLSELLTRHLGDSISSGEDLDALFIRDIRPNGVFKLSEDFLTYVYGEYEIGPYYLGIIEVRIPWEELDGLLR